MERQLISALDALPAVTAHLTDIKTAAKAAAAAATSATALHPVNQSLSARRVQRSENLLSHLHGTKALLESELPTLAGKLRDLKQTKPVRDAAWDRLSDSWWLARAAELFDGVQEASEGVRRIGRLEEGGGLYVGRVARIRQEVGAVSQIWDRFLELVRDWEGVARAAAEGLGEEGSLLGKGW